VDNPGLRREKIVRKEKDFLKIHLNGFCTYFRQTDCWERFDRKSNLFTELKTEFQTRVIGIKSMV